MDGLDEFCVTDGRVLVVTVVSVELPFHVLPVETVEAGLVEVEDTSSFLGGGEGGEYVFIPVEFADVEVVLQRVCILLGVGE